MLGTLIVTGPGKAQTWIQREISSSSTLCEENDQTPLTDRYLDVGEWACVTINLIDCSLERVSYHVNNPNKTECFYQNS